MIHAPFAAWALALLLGGPALAQGAPPPPAPAPVQVPGSGPAPAPAPAPSGSGAGPSGAARPAPAARPASPAGPRGAAPSPTRPPAGTGRRARSFEACNKDALSRRLRGAERRRFVYRCQGGPGRPLFRRRGPAAGNP